MSLSVGGGQLPLSAFFGSSGSPGPGKRSTKPKVASKRKESPVRGQAAEPAGKKRKQKDNVTPSSDRIFDDATPNLEGAPGTSKARRRQSSSTKTEVEAVDALVELTDGVGANTCAGDALIDLIVDRSDDNIVGSVPKDGHNLETPPLTPEAQARRRDFKSHTSLPSPPLTAPGAKRIRKERDDGGNRREDVSDLPQVNSIDRGTRLGPLDAKDRDNGTYNVHMKTLNVP